MTDIKTIRRKLSEREEGTIGTRRFFSVLIPIVRCKDELYFLFEKRADGIRQPGDICFPGGAMEKGETGTECALRETFEEIGIKNIEVLGEFDTLYEIAGITMYTVVGLIEEAEFNKLKPNPSEVKETFLVPLNYFKKEEPYIYEGEVVQKVEDFPYVKMGIREDYKWRRGKNPIFIYHYGNHVIWGLTAKIAKWFSDEIL